MLFLLNFIIICSILRKKGILDGFSKKILIFKDWTLKKIFWKDDDFEVSGTRKCTVARTRNCCCWPSSPLRAEASPSPPQRPPASWAYPSVNTQQSSKVSSPWREKETSLQPSPSEIYLYRYNKSATITVEGDLDSFKGVYSCKVLFFSVLFLM